MARRQLNFLVTGAAFLVALASLAVGGLRFVGACSVTSSKVEYVTRVTRFFNSHKSELRAVAAVGTHLGIVREGGLIPHELDIDFYLPDSQCGRLIEILDEAVRPGGELSGLSHSVKGEEVFYKWLSHPSVGGGRIRTNCVRIYGSSIPILRYWSMWTDVDWARATDMGPTLSSSDTSLRALATLAEPYLVERPATKRQPDPSWLASFWVSPRDIVEKDEALERATSLPVHFRAMILDKLATSISAVAEPTRRTYAPIIDADVTRALISRWSTVPGDDNGAVRAVSPVDLKTANRDSADVPRAFPTWEEVETYVTAAVPPALLGAISKRFDVPPKHVQAAFATAVGLSGHGWVVPYDTLVEGTDDMAYPFPLFEPVVEKSLLGVPVLVPASSASLGTLFGWSWRWPAPKGYRSLVCSPAGGLWLPIAVAAVVAATVVADVGVPVSWKRRLGLDRSAEAKRAP